MTAQFGFYTIQILSLTIYSRPNIIIIYPDNQDLLLGSTSAEFMPILNSRIIDRGVTIQNAFVSTPVCCPSRAELLTGRYFHNIGPPYPPNGTCMSVDPYIPVFGNNTLFQIMYNNGYHVGGFGKIVNDMAYWCNSYNNNNSKPVINGFSRLYIPCNYLDYYGHVYFNKFENETWEYSYTNTSYQSPELYETSQIGNATLDWIDEIYSNNNGYIHNISFFALWGVHAPHFPATPAVWYQNRFNDSNKYYAPRTVNFNKHYDNKHWMVNAEPELDDIAISHIDQMWRNRLRSMLSVEDFIHDLDATLEKWDIINNTFIFYVSDNGMHLGQWRITNDFKNIYETDIRVPFYIRGANIKSKSNISQMISNVDIAPTIYELAGIIYDRNEYDIDGKSFAKYLFDDSTTDNNWRDMLLFEYIYQNNLTFANYTIWYSINKSRSSNTSYIGEIVNGSCCNNLTGEPYWIDNSYQTSFRSLRIINYTFNITYAEYVDPSYTQYALNNPQFYELYNLTNDPYQTNNIYNETNELIQQYLHETLSHYGSCKADGCP